MRGAGRFVAVTARVLVFVAAVVPGAVALVVPALGSWPWAMPALAGALGLTLLAMRPKAWGLVLLGLAMAVLAAQLGGKARNVLDVTAGLETEGSWPGYDLTSEPFPASSPEYVEVRGFFRSEWTLDEYAVADGQHPDQNAAPEAVLVPMAGTTGAIQNLEGAVVIARVPPGRASQGGVQRVRGKATPVDPGVVATLIQVEGADPAELGAVMVDVFAVPTRRDGIVRAALAVVCMLIGAACFWFAVGTGTEQS